MGRVKSNINKLIIGRPRPTHAGFSVGTTDRNHQYLAFLNITINLKKAAVNYKQRLVCLARGSN
jgi:hypothetical protein